LIRRILLALSLAIPVATGAQAPLKPADFVVAGIPDNYPEMFVEEDTARIRRILGAPTSVQRIPAFKDDSMTTWEYPGLTIMFGGMARQGITLTTSQIPTARGLRVGDTVARVRQLYGAPREVVEDQWTYGDPREHLHVIQVTVHDGKVTSIYIGTLWD
jgi:hypothetical protein